MKAEHSRTIGAALRSEAARLMAALHASNTYDVAPVVAYVAANLRALASRFDKLPPVIGGERRKGRGR